MRVVAERRCFCQVRVLSVLFETYLGELLPDLLLAWLGGLGFDDAPRRQLLRLLSWGLLHVVRHCQSSKVL